MRRLSRLTGLAATALFLGATLTGCAASVPTCGEFAAMADDTGLLSSFSDEQTEAMDAALDAAGYENGVVSGAANRALAGTQIVAYCNIYDGVSNQNQSSSITEAFQ
ncbi:hypothetical protein [Microbacterium halotolerans]|uniref:hypothetical protein n=1 Tax=Microbacterium halotolerans TaxID=246613 RepID=UPI000E6AC4E6|nr:hypothetical protein [Microbacterium halotolerans]